MEGAQAAQVGLMARASTAPDAAMGAMFFCGSSTSTRFRFTARAAAGDSTTTSGGASGIALPAWVRLARAGSELVGSSSPDGQTWTELGRSTLEDPPSMLLAGLFGIGSESLNPQATFKALAARACLQESPAPRLRRGDANADKTLNIADAVFVLAHLFAQGTAPACKDAADANDDGALDIADAVKILGHLFAQAGPLAAPFGECGADPTEDGLDCGKFAPCE
jgi:hypothetical protein